MIILIIAALLGIGRGGPCVTDADCDKGKRHLICVAGSDTCQLGCRVDADCTNGSWCRAVPSEIHKQCVQIDPRSAD